MIGLRSRAAETTGALSAFTQGVGYLFAATGPLLVGVLLGGTDNWSAPFAMLFAVLAVAAGAGWIAARERYVDDELVPARLRDGA
jgi:CP family cyanate transporter-like MFS transporter